MRFSEHILTFLYENKILMNEIVEDFEEYPEVSDRQILEWREEEEAYQKYLSQRGIF